MAINYVEKGFGLHEAVAAAGHALWQSDGVWLSSNDQAVQALIDAYDPLPVAQAARIATINAECRARLTARFGDALEQGTRWAGGYGEAERQAQLTGVASTIDASNVAQNAVLAAVTLADVEAVTVSWPVI